MLGRLRCPGGAGPCRSWGSPETRQGDVPLTVLTRLAAKPMPVSTTRARDGTIRVVKLATASHERASQGEAKGRTGMIDPPDHDDANDPVGAQVTAHAEAALQRLPPSIQRLTGWLLTHWPGRMGVRTALACIRVGIFDRSMTVAAQFFTSVLPILIIIATWRNARDAGRLADVLGLPDQSRAVLEDAVQGANTAAFGVVGTLMVLVSATSLSRALTRAFTTAWDLQAPRTTLGSAWRWLAVVVGLALGLVAVRALSVLAADLPPGAVWQVVVAVLCDIALALSVPWVLLSGTLRLRLLLPGALLYALVMTVFRPASAAWLPRALDASAGRYGSLGVSFTYLAWLYVWAFILLLTAILGQVAATDSGGIGRWIRGASRTPVDLGPTPGTATVDPLSQDDVLRSLIDPG